MNVLRKQEVLFIGLPSQRQTVAAFFVKGEPVSKSRARFTKRGSKTQAYTPEKTKVAEESIAWHYRAAGGRLDPDLGATYGVSATFYNGTRQRRDIDNMLKLILDGLNGVAWPDDNQVVEIVARKVYVGSRDAALTEVVVYRVGVADKKTSKCEECGVTYTTYDSWTTAGRRFCSRECARAASVRSRQRVCETCGLEFVVDKPNTKGRYCSRECQTVAGRTEVICTVCGQTFTRQKCHVRERNFCGPSCVRAFHNQVARSRPQGTCESCGGPVSKKTYKKCRACFQSKPAGIVKGVHEVILRLIPAPDGERDIPTVGAYSGGEIDEGPRVSSEAPLTTTQPREA